jgi:nitric oxide reductase subunit C
MKVRLWVGLFIAFIIYTWLVYNYCDKNNASAAEPGKQALAGWNTWQDKNCQSCHQLYGLGGYLGPDLTNVAADPLKNDAYLQVFIKNGTGKMPNFNLTDTEVSDLIAFLKWVDKSGSSRVPKEKVTWTGNYNIEN